MPRIRRNRDAAAHIQALRSFTGSNFFGRRYGRFYVVYSYGHHHPLLVAHDGTDTIPSIRIVNTGRYSQSTSRHASIVRGALSDRADVLESSAEYMQAMDDNIRRAHQRARRHQVARETTMATTGQAALEPGIDHAANQMRRRWTAVPFAFEIPGSLRVQAWGRGLTWTETGRVAEAAQVVKAPAPPKAKAIYSGDLEPLALLEHSEAEST
ncbi:MAG: hypothetical protein LCH53_13195 [Bacteroidetes bacterium]|nr:hypothetical protein [Bacteroidota bacterium]